MPGRVFIFGNHPLRASLAEQFRSRGAEAVLSNAFSVEALNGALPEEMAVLTPQGRDDAESLSFLSELASVFRGTAATSRPVVHLLLQSQVTLRALQVSDFDPAVNEVFEVFPFTMEEAWADTMIVRLPGIESRKLPPLDREPVAADSRRFVHLVIAGFDSYAESLAVRAAQVAHFPNYDGKAQNPLRTRITFIMPGIARARDRFITRFHHLFDNSYYRCIDPEKRTSSLHHPVYEGRREDFVDIEWEFVDAELSHPVVKDKLVYWAGDDGRQLTIAVSGQDDEENMDAAIALPDAVLEKGIPVMVRMHRDILSGTVGQSPRFRGIIPFGMDSDGYDTGLPVMKMARLVHYFYTRSYGPEGIPTVFPPEEVDAEWRRAGNLRLRLSNVCNVISMGPKMRSLGHSSEDAHAFYALTEEETVSLSRVEHNRWCVERLLSGMRPCTDEEREAIGRDITLKKAYKSDPGAHYDLCAFDELGRDEKGTDVRTYDYALTACIPLIVESYLEEPAR